MENDRNSGALITADQMETQLPEGYMIDGNQSLAISLARAEIDQQIATARALPRQIARVVQNINTLATLDAKTAEECVYALPRGGKAIKGPSIRLAEIIAGQWGNCRVGARTVHVDRFEKYVEAEGVFHDLETNTAVTSRVRRRIVDKNGRIYNDDMILTTSNAACSIAKRNAILGGVPKAVWRRAYDEVEKVIAGDVQTLVERRDRAMKAFAAFGLTPERVCKSMGLAGVDDITLEHLPILFGAHSALKSGEATAEELFPVPKDKNNKDTRSLGDRLDDIAGDEGRASARGNRSNRSGSRNDQSESSSEGKPSSDGADQEAAARQAGVNDARNGKAKRQMPAKYRNDDVLSQAYADGFDSVPKEE